MLKSARKQEKQSKQEKDAEGRMPLVEHLRELRNRLLKSVLAILVITVVAAFYYKNLIDFMLKPMLDSVGCTDGVVSQRNGRLCADMTVNGLIAPFSIALKVSLTAACGALGAGVALPALGLRRPRPAQAREALRDGLRRRRRSAVRRRCGTRVQASAEDRADPPRIHPDNARNLLPVDDYLDLVTRMVVVFGLAFELPLLLILLNFTGVLTAKRLASWWRAMVLGITIFAAFATPTGDPLTMLSLAAPIIALYFVALGICLVNDRRRRRGNPDALLDDDEAAELDLTPAPIGELESVQAPTALPEQADGGRRQINGYDDAT